MSSIALTAYPYYKPPIDKGLFEEKPTKKASVDSEEAVHTPNAVLNQGEIATSSYDHPPDGGLMAWLQVAGSFSLYFNTWYIPFRSSFVHWQASLISSQGNR